MSSIHEELRNMIGLRRSSTASSNGADDGNSVKTFGNMYEVMAKEAGRLREQLNQMSQVLQQQELEKQQLEEEGRMLKEMDDRRKKETRKLKKEADELHCLLELKDSSIGRLKSFAAVLTVFLVVFVLHNHYLNHQLETQVAQGQQLQQQQILQLQHCSSSLARLSRTALSGTTQLNLTRSECDRKVTVVELESRTQLKNCRKHCSGSLEACVDEMNLLKEAAEEIRGELEKHKEIERKMRTIDHLISFFQSFRRGVATFLGLPVKSRQETEFGVQRIISSKYGCWFDSQAWRYICKR